MYLAIKEIKHEKLRYGMIIAMIALISWLIFILTGLAQGLGNQNTAAIDSWNFKSIALNKDADVNLRQSLITSDGGKRWLPVFPLPCYPDAVPIWICGKMT